MSVAENSGEKSGEYCNNPQVLVCIYFCPLFADSELAELFPVYPFKSTVRMRLAILGSERPYGVDHLTYS